MYMKGGGGVEIFPKGTSMGHQLGGGGQKTHFSQFGKDVFFG